MSKGILVFAFNNRRIDYVTQAVELARRAKQHLGLPVSIITDSKIDSNVFDEIITYKISSINKKRYYDGSLSNSNLNFKNDARPCAYDLTPYNETLLLDTDYIIADDILSNCYKQTNDFLIYKDAVDLAGHRNYKEFDYVSNTGVDFYWATAVFFRKTELNKRFFELLKHIQENWIHYKQVYQIEGNTYRNDHAFSIAIHIINGFQKGNFAKSMPGKLIYTTDKDILEKLNEDEFTFLLEKKNRKGEYTLAKAKNQSIHIMNKFSLDRALKNE